MFNSQRWIDFFLCLSFKCHNLTQILNIKLNVLSVTVILTRVLPGERVIHETLDTLSLHGGNVTLINLFNIKCWYFTSTPTGYRRGVTRLSFRVRTKMGKLSPQGTNH